MAKKNFIVFLSAFAIDQLSKYFIPTNFIIKNSGLPFGINMQEFFSLITVCILLFVFIALYVRFYRRINFGFVLIISGAASNLVDRIFLGYVRDFIDVGIATVNLADIFIWIGIVIVILRTKSEGSLRI